MLVINRKIEYSLIVLKEMFDSPKKTLFKAKDFSEKFNISLNLVAKVLQTLTTNKLVSSSQGPHGGYSLLADLSKVSFINLYEAFLGTYHIANCIDKDSEPCELFCTCNILQPIKFLNNQIGQLFKNMSIKEILTAKVKTKMENIS